MSHCVAGRGQSRVVDARGDWSRHVGDGACGPTCHFASLRSAAPCARDFVSTERHSAQMAISGPLKSSIPREFADSNLRNPPRFSSGALRARTFAHSCAASTLRSQEERSPSSLDGQGLPPGSRQQCRDLATDSRVRVVSGSRCR